jgi:type IV pilus assembly protein PilM
MVSVYSAPKTIFHRLWNEPPPSLALEFTPEGLAAARWRPGAGALERFSFEPLAEGALRPSPVRENLARPEEVRRAAAAALQNVVRRPGGRLALFLPDLAARVSTITFEQLPDKHDEVLPLIRWRLKKTVPFEIEEASVAYHRQGRGEEGEEVLVSVALTSIVRQYEATVESLGYEPGFATLSSLAALGLVDSQPGRAAGTMLLRSTGSLMTILLTSPGRLRVFRASELPPGGNSLEEIVSDAYGSAVYYQDNYKETVERIYLAGFGQQTAALQEAIERELGVRPGGLLLPGMRSADAKFLGIYGMVAEQAKE